MKKLQSAGNSQLPNPYDLLVQKNEDCRLPDISWPDICNYLINHPSCVFTNESLKAYKFLDAYNYFDLSRIQDVQYHEIEQIDSPASSNQRYIHYVIEADTFPYFFN